MNEQILTVYNSYREKTGDSLTAAVLTLAGRIDAKEAAELFSGELINELYAMLDNHSIPVEVTEGYIKVELDEPVSVRVSGGVTAYSE